MRQRTPEQQKQIDEAIQAGERRVMTDFTPEQSAQWRAAADEEEASRPETIKSIRRMREAAQEPGVFGDLRRAISARLLAEHRQGRPPSTEPLSIDARRLEEFREGVAPLPADDLRRLIEILGLQLVQAIPPVHDRQETPA